MLRQGAAVEALLERCFSSDFIVGPLPGFALVLDKPLCWDKEPLSKHCWNIVFHLISLLATSRDLRGFLINSCFETRSRCQNAPGTAPTMKTEKKHRKNNASTAAPCLKTAVYQEPKQISGGCQQWNQMKNNVPTMLRQRLLVSRQLLNKNPSRKNPSRAREDVSRFYIFLPVTETRCLEAFKRTETNLLKSVTA